MDTSAASDFWWLSQKEATQAWFVGVGHHAPWNAVWNGVDDPAPTGSASIDQDQPVLNGWAHSVNWQNEDSKQFKRYPLSFISDWRSRWDNRNVYRTMRLWRQSGNAEAIAGPFLVDIDNENEDLDDTLEIARQAFAWMAGTWKLTPDQDVRIFFSGRKGFNIEVVPASLGITGNIEQQISASAEYRDTIIRELKGRNGLHSDNGNTVSAHGTVIDRVYSLGFGLTHPYTRLHDSFNCWLSDDVQNCRRRIRIPCTELGKLTIESILQLADAGS